MQRFIAGSIAVAAGVGMMAAGPAGATVTLLRAGLAANASAVAGSGSRAVRDKVLNQDAINALPATPFSVTAHASADRVINGQITSAADAIDTATVDFDSASRGTVIFSGGGTMTVYSADGLGASIDNTPFDPTAPLGFSGRQLFRYDFNTDLPTTLSITYLLDNPTLGTFSGAGGIQIQLFAPGAFGSRVIFDDTAPFNSAGSTGRISLSDTGTYILQLIATASSFQANQSGIGSSSATHRDEFSFVIGDSVAPFPEPSSWALLTIGFGFTGFALRRRSRFAAVTA